MNEEQLERRYEADRIAARVTDVATALDGEFKDQRLVLISILKGSSFFLADLARRMAISVACEYISVRREEGSDQALHIDFKTDFNIQGRPALLLKDVVSTGVIENYLIDHLRSRGASLIHLAAIIDRTDQRTTDVAVDYSLFAAPGGLFAGYGMAYRGRYAHLPYIAEITGAPVGVAAAPPGQ
jgi:hypoxanthine phosphoribosyltransferase